ncbi:hypothetical protein HDU92_005195 [Lobulomyces angularis]|nr:hypothetical protein HDU92_005195 [Lobulomyces angularis]
MSNHSSTTEKESDPFSPVVVYSVIFISIFAFVALVFALFELKQRKKNGPTTSRSISNSDTSSIKEQLPAYTENNSSTV